jgi:predicted GNAT superfamily acetyltransferase
MNFHIRNTDSKDFESILKINQAAIPNVFELDADEFFLLLEICEYSKVVEINCEIAGYIFALGKGLVYDGEEYNWFCDNLDSDFLYIDQIAIGEKWKGMGCGKSLYEDLGQYAVQNCKEALVCEVNYEPLNEESMAFHKKLGFNELLHLGARGIFVSLLVKLALQENA